MKMLKERFDYLKNCLAEPSRLGFSVPDDYTRELVLQVERLEAELKESEMHRYLASQSFSTTMDELNRMYKNFTLSDEDIETNLRLIDVLFNCHKIDTPTAVGQLEDGLSLMLNMVKRYLGHLVTQERIDKIKEEMTNECD